MTRLLTFLLAISIALTTVSADCTPGVLDPDTINQLPSSLDLTLSFTNDNLSISTNVIQTSPARSSFTYTFHIDGSGAEDCNVAAPTLGSLNTDPTVCVVPVTAIFSWPPQENCFVKTTVPDSGVDTYTSTLILSWTEQVTTDSGTTYNRTVTVQFPVEVDIPNTINVTSMFTSSSNSTASYITAFYISSADFSTPSAGTVAYVFDVPTLTSMDGSKVLLVDTLSTTTGTLTQIGSPGVASGALWKQVWEWDFSEGCAGISAKFSFRATFVCESPGTDGCQDSDYNGFFQDIVLTVTTASVCPTIPDATLDATATLELMNADSRVQTVFSSLDSIKAQISHINNEDILSTAVVSDVYVNGKQWTVPDQYTLDNDDQKHPIIIFASTESLITSTDLIDNPALDSNTIIVTLQLTWSDGGVHSKRSIVRATTTYAPTTTASQNFTLFSVPETSGSSSFSTPAYGLVAAVALFLAALM